MTDFLYVLGGCLAFACVAFGLQCLVETALGLVSVRRIIEDLEVQVLDLSRDVLDQKEELDDQYTELFGETIDRMMYEDACGHLADMVDNLYGDYQTVLKNYNRIIDQLPEAELKIVAAFANQQATIENQTKYIETQNIELGKFYRAIACLSTLVGDMEINDPEVMAKQIVDRFSRKGKKNDSSRTPSGNNDGHKICGAHV